MGRVLRRRGRWKGAGTEKGWHWIGKCPEKGNVLRRGGQRRGEGAGKGRALKKGDAGSCVVQVFMGRAHKKLVMCTSVLRTEMLSSK
jgi:hypothetical protein